VRLEDAMREDFELGGGNERGIHAAAVKAGGR
jgi:hypothetical protein